VRPPRVVLLEPFPIPYFASLHRALAKRADIDIHVAYGNLQTTNATFVDKGFGTTLQWDVPVLDGYSWCDLSTVPFTHWLRELRRSDVLFLSTYHSGAALIAWALARMMRRPVLFGSDAIDLTAQSNALVRWGNVRRLVTSTTVRLAAGVNATSTRSLEHYRRYADDPEKIALVPYVADRDVFVEQSAQQRAAARAQFGFRSSDLVVGFVGKLIARKRPADVIRAVSAVDGAKALIVGSGPLDEEMRALASSLGVQAVFTGFKNQSELPNTYAAMDVAVLPSEQEPFGLVLHEAELCGTVAACTTACGAFDDLVRPVAPWLGFGVGDVDALALALRNLRERAKTGDLHERVRTVAEAWNVEFQAEAFVRACRRALSER
jgi:glycosyltransferase involved in cell wall biosynthesis